MNSFILSNSFKSNIVKESKNIIYFSRNYFFSKKKYFAKDLPFEYKVLNHHKIPDTIEKPAYAKIENYNYPESSDIAIHKTQTDIDNHRKSCQITAKVLSNIEELSKLDKFNTTEDIDQAVHNKIIELNAYPTAVGFMGFPKSVCTSPNEVVVHGIPNTHLLNEGDAINVDVTSFYNGFHGDSSIMIFKNKSKVHEEVLRLSEVTREAMYKAIKYCKPYEKICNIGIIIEEYVKSKGFNVIREFSGHGVGKGVHMKPSIVHFDYTKFNPNYSKEIMKPGMTFTIEPVVCMKDYHELSMLSDNWTVILPPNNPSAQWEHIVLITNDGHEILTMRENEKPPQTYYD